MVLKILVSDGKYTISTSITQVRYRVACVNELPTDTQLSAYNGVSADNTNRTITIDTTGYKYLIINATDPNAIQVEKGTAATEFEPYKENSYVIPTTPLRSLLNGVKDTIEEDRIHYKTNQYAFTGTEIFYKSSYTTETSFCCFTSSILPKPKINGNSGFCNIGNIAHADNIKDYTSGFFYNTNESHFLKIEKSAIPNWDENLTDTEKISLFKSYLAEQYANGTPVTIQYELAEEVIELFDEEQQAVIDSISTMLGTQYFTCDANMRITYVRDNGLSDMYETKQNAIRKYAQQEMKLTETGALIESLVSVTNTLNDGFKVGDEELQKKLEELGKNLEEYQLTTSTSFEQTEKNFQMKFNELIESINTNAEGNSEKFAEIVKYIRFEDGNIVLGRSDNQLILKIQNDRISYQQNGSEVAYFSNNKLYVTTLEVTHSLIIGNFAFIPRANGNLSFKKVGGN